MVNEAVRKSLAFIAVVWGSKNVCHFLSEPFPWTDINASLVDGTDHISVPFIDIPITISRPFLLLRLSFSTLTCFQDQSFYSLPDTSVELSFDSFYNYPIRVSVVFSLLFSTFLLFPCTAQYNRPPCIRHIFDVSEISIKLLSDFL